MKIIRILGYTIEYSLVIQITREKEYMNLVRKEAKLCRLRVYRIWREHDKQLPLKVMVDFINLIYYKHHSEEKQ